MDNSFWANNLPSEYTPLPAFILHPQAEFQLLKLKTKITTLALTQDICGLSDDVRWELMVLSNRFTSWRIPLTVEQALFGFIK